MVKTVAGWRARRRNVRSREEESSDDNAAEVIMNTLTITEAPRNPRFALRSTRTKRMKLVDLEAMTGLPGSSGEAGAGSGSSIFAEPIWVDDEQSEGREPFREYSGAALLCFVTTENFVGLVQLDQPGPQCMLRLRGVETLAECNREFCGASDCCGERAFLVAIQGPQAHEKRSFVLRSVGIGDYVALEGRGFRFDTDLVPADSQREQILQRNFEAIPPTVLCEAVLCMGRVRMRWQFGESEEGQPGECAPADDMAMPTVSPLGSFMMDASEVSVHRGRDVSEEQEGYAGDKSSDASSADELERSVRAILPMLAQVTMPTPEPGNFSFDELLARGGRPMSQRSASAADLEDDWLSS